MQLKHEEHPDLSVRWLTVYGLSIRVAIKQGTGSGPPLMIFNGIGASFELLRPFLEAIREHEVIIFDAPGAGKSGAPLLPWRMRDYADAALSILQQLGYQEASVLGLSWGGALAQQFARQYPKNCSALVLAATSPGHLMVPANPDVLMHMLNPRRYRDNDYMKRITGKIYGGSFRTNKLAAGRFVNATSPPSSRGYYYQLSAMIGWSSLPWLHRLTQRTLVLQGEDDPLIPRSNGRILAALIPNAELVEVDCGHLFLLTRAAQAASHIEQFLHRASAVSI